MKENIMSFMPEYRSRVFTNRILELVDEGVLNKDDLIRSLLCWMSERDVKEFYERNLSEPEETE